MKSYLLSKGGFDEGEFSSLNNFLVTNIRGTITSSAVMSSQFHVVPGLTDGCMALRELNNAKKKENNGRGLTMAEANAFMSQFK